MYRSKKILPKVGKDKKPYVIDMDALKKDIQMYPDSYCRERGERLGASATGIRDAQYCLGVSYKKTQKHLKASHAKRFMFCQKIRRLKKESRSIVYVDESGFVHDMPRTHGYSTKGKRCYGVCDWGAKAKAF